MSHKKISIKEHLVEAQSSPAPEEEKKVAPEKRNRAFLRYMAFLFGVAFLLVVVSLVMTQHNSMETISEMNQNHSSTLIRVEQLQENYQKAIEEKSQLMQRLQELETQAEALQEQNRELTGTNASLEEELGRERAQAETEQNRIQEELEVYQLLCKAQLALEQGRIGDFNTCMKELSQRQDKLTQEAKEVYQMLLQKQTGG